MTQTRLHLTSTKAVARSVYLVLEQAFEDEGWPLGVTEVDEDRDVHRVELYVEGDGTDELATARRLLQEAGIHAPIDAEPMPDIDWVAKSLEGLKPVRAGRFVVHGSHDRHTVPSGSIGIEIEAGQAFGTGHHGTTAGCLDMITRVMKRGSVRRALDLGTGSAVLAIAVAKLGRVPVLATDIDPVATRVAAGNVALNKVEAFVTTCTATGFHHPAFRANGPFDLVIANILARPLMQLAPAMKRHCSSGGQVILSGILDRQARGVVAAYVGQGFRLSDSHSQEGWTTLLMQR